MARSELSIIIPYFAERRTVYLMRELLFLYSHFEGKISVYVALSGSEEIIKELVNFKKGIDKKNIFLYKFEEKNKKSIIGFLEKLLKVTSQVKSNYIAVCGADDFVIPEVAIKATKVLEGDKKISVVMGQTAIVDMEKGVISSFQQLDNLFEQPDLRLRKILNIYQQLFYNVTRTEYFSKALKKTIHCFSLNPILKKDASFSEIALAFEFLKIGKIYYQDELMLIRFSHKDNSSSYVPTFEQLLSSGLHTAFFKQHFHTLKNDMPRLQYFKYKVWVIKYQLRYMNLHFIDLLAYKRHPNRFFKMLLRLCIKKIFHLKRPRNFEVELNQIQKTEYEEFIQNNINFLRTGIEKISV